MRLQSFSGDVSVLNVCKLNTNYAIKFYECSRRKLLPNVHQKMFFLIYEDSWQSIQLSMLFVHLLFNKRIVPLEENSSKCNYFIDGKHNMDNFKDVVQRL